MPVRNEERHLRAAVRRVLAQQYAGPMEILLSVGPSEDRTEAIAAELAAADPRIRVIENPQGITPVALNLAIAAAKHSIIVRVDGHGELSAGYIATAVRLLAETGAANVGGLMDAQGTTPFEQAVAAAYNSRLGLGGGGFHLAQTPAGPADTVFLGVFRKEALAAVGGFDETLQRAQDWELNYRLRKAGCQVYFSPELRVVYRPRPGWRALARQFYRTGQWRREVVRRHPDTLSLRYLAPPITVAASGFGILAALVSAMARLRWWPAWLVLPLLYLSFLTAATTVVRDLPGRARAWFPVVLAIMHGAWGLGFLAGRDRQ
ncbi:MAG: glycosyl transferase family 2 [Arachnia propionica]|nr:MAG: glycosyl transferase family 2 [Arachnia propionica]